MQTSLGHTKRLLEDTGILTLSLVEMRASVAAINSQLMTLLENPALGDLSHLLLERLVAFESVPNKHIIYGGDFGGDFAMRLMDLAYGENSYTVYATILPCYPEELRRYVLARARRREKCILYEPRRACRLCSRSGIVTHGRCSDLAPLIAPDQDGASLEVCGCFHVPGSLQEYADQYLTAHSEPDRQFSGWWGTTIRADKDRRFFLYPFAGIDPRLCEALALAFDQGKSPWEWWRIHVCQTEDYVDWSAARLRASWYGDARTLTKNLRRRIETYGQG